jgi:hypothetical protein
VCDELTDPSHETRGSCFLFLSPSSHVSSRRCINECAPSALIICSMRLVRGYLHRLLLFSHIEGTETLTNTDALIEFISRTIFHLKQQVPFALSALTPLTSLKGSSAGQLSPKASFPSKDRNVCLALPFSCLCLSDWLHLSLLANVKMMVTITAEVQHNLQSLLDKTSGLIFLS